MGSELDRSAEQSVAFLVKTTTDKIEVLQSYVIQSLTKDVLELTTLNDKRRGRWKQRFERRSDSKVAPNACFAREKIASRTVRGSNANFHILL